MPTVTLVGLPSGVAHTTVHDPESGLTFEPNIPVEVDDATVKRLKSVEQFGYAFWVGDPAATKTASPPLPAVAAAVVTPEPIPAADAASPQ